MSLWPKNPSPSPINPDSELGRLLDETNGAPVVLLRGSTHFRVIRVADDPLATYDPAKLRAGLKKVAGLLSPEEGDRIIEMIYRGREEDTRPIERPCRYHGAARGPEH